MSVISYLRQLEYCRIKMEQLNNEYRAMWQNAIHSGAAKEGERVQISGAKDKLSEDVARIVDAENNLVKRWHYYAQERDKIISHIEMLSDARLEQILFKRYAEEKGFEEIAEELDYSEGHVRRLHAEAIKAFRKLARAHVFEMSYIHVIKC